MPERRNQRAHRARTVVPGLTVLVPVCAALGWELGVAGVVVALVTVVVVALVYSWRTVPMLADDTDQGLRVHLARARRRDEPADLLVVHVEDGASRIACGLKENLRVTDSSYLRWVPGGWELWVMLDRQQLDRDALQARLSCVAGCALQFGWARFPEDGYTLAVLVAHARAACGDVPSRAAWGTPGAVPDLLVAPVAASQVQGRTK